MNEPANLDAIKGKLNLVDVLSGMTGPAAQAEFVAVCEDLAINDVAELVAEVERLRAELAIARKERADAVNHANQLRPDDWKQQRTHLVAEVARMNAHWKTVRWQCDSYLARARAELPQGEPLWLIESALGHVRDTAYQATSGPTANDQPEPSTAPPDTDGAC
jgi:hypothetical protein